MQKNISTFLINPTPWLHTLFVLFPVSLWLFSIPTLPVRISIKIYDLTAEYIPPPISTPQPPLITICGVQIKPQPLLFLLSLNSLLCQNTSIITLHRPSPLLSSASSASLYVRMPQAVMIFSVMWSKSMFSRKKPFISLVGLTFSNIDRYGVKYCFLQRNV